MFGFLGSQQSTEKNRVNSLRILREEDLRLPGWPEIGFSKIFVTSEMCSFPVHHHLMTMMTMIRLVLFFLCHLFEQKQVALKPAQNMSLRSIWIFALGTLTFRTLIMLWLSTPAVVMMHLVRISWHDGHVSRVILYTKTYIVCFKGQTNCPFWWIHHLRWSIYESVFHCFGWYSMWQDRWAEDVYTAILSSH